MFFTFCFVNVLGATAPCNFSTSQLQKGLRTPQFFNIFTHKRAFRYSGVQFFDIRTSKSGPNMRCFVHFDLKMCFSLQRRAIFPHLNFKKWSEPAVFVSLQRRAIFHLSSKQLPPHPPLYQAYFSTQPTHKSLKKHSISRLP